MTRPIPLDPGVFYHIYNRGNNRENLFVEERNYLYFMRLFDKYVSPVADTFAYCLLGNHFHFLVRIKNDKGSHSAIRWRPSVPSRAFANFFSTYAKAINNAYQRTGSLFEKPFRRIALRSDAQLIRLVGYIHQNPKTHGFVDDFRNWPHSSYPVILSDETTWLSRNECLKWFGGVAGFERAHSLDVIKGEHSFSRPAKTT